MKVMKGMKNVNSLCPDEGLGVPLWFPFKSVYYYYYMFFYFRSHAGELISLPGILAAVQRSVFSVIIR